MSGNEEKKLEFFFFLASNIRVIERIKVNIVRGMKRRKEKWPLKKISLSKEIKTQRGESKEVMELEKRKT